MGWRQRAARQMDNDGIRKLSPKEISPVKTCRHIEYRDEVITIYCKNKQRYSVKGCKGPRCFKHAIECSSLVEQKPPRC